MLKPHPYRLQIVSFLKGLRERIMEGFGTVETHGEFERKPWLYHSGQGGGEIGLLRGEVFEKAAVNWSGIEADAFPMSDGSGPFFATGVSLITHMANPHAPTVHMNLRFLETAGKHWFGGGFDLTPMGFPYQEDTNHFHRIAKESLDRFGGHLYPNFSKQAEEYFYIPHRKKQRGVGGIFFDHYNTGSFEDDYALWVGIGDSFLETILPIYQKRTHESFTPEDREKQLEMRAHYVEFNLLYDRGTKFGFLSGGNPEGILCSMPPLAKW
jgi:coproporphyrinogen III oxidase